MSPETIEEYFRSGVAVAFQLSTKTHSRLEIDPAVQEMRFFTPAQGSAPDVTGYERIEIDTINFVGVEGDWFQLTVDASGMHYEAYSLMVSIADQLHGGTSFRNAVSESLSTLRDLLSNRRRMTPEIETGLVGELLVFQHSVATIGEDSAIAAWLGPLSEEHDFSFDSFDAEVKTTRSESRTHKIGTATQLQPVTSRPLYFISVQVTNAGQAIEGFTVAELISQIRATLDRNQRSFDSNLSNLGWRDIDSDLYGTRFQLRSTPRAYLVGPGFPAITTNLLEAVVPQWSHVAGISYQIDLTTLPHVLPPAPLNQFCEETK